SAASGLSLCGVAVVLVVTGIGMVCIQQRLDQRDLSGVFLERPRQKLDSFGRFWNDKNFSNLSRGLDETLTRIRQTNPLPKLAGSVDVIPPDQSVVLAHRLEYQPRPVFQNYQTNSAPLLRKNSAFWESRRAPEYVLFYFPPDVGFRNIWFNEGGTWPSLLAQYDLVDFQSPYFVLKKRAVRRHSSLRSVETRQVLIGQRIALPRSPGIVLASIRLKRTLLGEIAMALYKIPLPTMTANLVDGSSGTWDVVTNSATEPFVMSTFMDSAANLAGLFLGFESANVASFELALPPGLGGLWYEKHAIVAYSSLRLDAGDQDEQLPTSSSLRGLRQLLALAENSDVGEGRRRLVIVEPRPGLPRLHVLARAPSRSWLQPTSAHFKIGVGIANEFDTKASVTFKVSAVMTDGSARILWSRTLHPSTVDADRGQQI